MEQQRSIALRRVMVEWQRAGLRRVVWGFRECISAAKLDDERQSSAVLLNDILELEAKALRRLRARWQCSEAQQVCFHSPEGCIAFLVRTVSRLSQTVRKRPPHPCGPPWSGLGSLVRAFQAYCPCFPRKFQDCSGPHAGMTRCALRVDLHNLTPDVERLHRVENMLALPVSSRRRCRRWPPRQ